jgi:hypothetical protein
MELLTRYCYDPYIPVNKNDPAKWFKECFNDLVKIDDNGYVITSDGMILKYLGKEGNIELDESITGIAAEAFIDVNVNGTSSLRIPDSVTYIGDYAFAYTDGLESITIPGTVKEFGEYIFQNAGLKSIVFEDGIDEIPLGICDSCRLLEKAQLPSSVKKIGINAFSHCIALDIDVYSGFEELTNLTEIDNLAFSNCKMKTFVIPERITKIGRDAFFLNGDYGREPEPAEIIVMGETTDYADDFYGGLISARFEKGLDSVKLNTRIWTFSTEPNKKGKYLVGSRWNSVSGIDGYEYEASVYKNFKNATKADTTETEAEVYVNPGSKKKVDTLYSRVRAYRVIDESGAREYSPWINDKVKFDEY